VEEIFKQLPPPPPSLVARGWVDNSVPLTNMNVYYNAQGGCFHENCSISMFDGPEKPVKKLVKGDRVRTPNGNGAEILCVLKMHCPNKKASLVEVGDLLITPYHPIRVDGTWSFPCQIPDTRTSEVSCEAVYSFVLNEESEHVVIINNTECVTLGHRFQEDVVRHEYFGSSAVVDDLKGMDGWGKGLVEFPDMGNCFVRDKVTGKVNGFSTSVSVMSPGA